MSPDKASFSTMPSVGPLPPSNWIALASSSRHFKRTASVVLDEAGGNDVCDLLSLSFSLTSDSFALSSFSLLGFLEEFPVSLLGVLQPGDKWKLSTRTSPFSYQGIFNMVANVPSQAVLPQPRLPLVLFTTAGYRCICAKELRCNAPERNFFQFLINVLDRLITSSSEVDLRRALTVMPILVLVRTSRFTGIVCSAFKSSSACSWPYAITYIIQQHEDDSRRVQDLLMSTDHGLNAGLQADDGATTVTKWSVTLASSDRTGLSQAGSSGGVGRTLPALETCPSFASFSEESQPQMSRCQPFPS
uniref:Uncharacterized protein n=1 Tax=Timema genevievae TaxID=629358 RepID=A0A7R9PP82_TIMGE|nr:unnamed protein product [Timema genevievae]